MLKEGSYACYWNRIYLVGPFGVGKTTLAKNLVGDAIPDMWVSTDGIWIYMGRAGMDTEQRTWVFLDKGKFVILIKELLCLYLLYCIQCLTSYVISEAVVAVFVWQLDLQLPVQSISIITDVVSSNRDQDEVYNIMQ